MIRAYTEKPGPVVATAPTSASSSATRTVGAAMPAGRKVASRSARVTSRPSGSRQSRREDLRLAVRPSRPRRWHRLAGVEPAQREGEVPLAEIDDQGQRDRRLDRLASDLTARRRLRSSAAFAERLSPEATSTAKRNGTTPAGLTDRPGHSARVGATRRGRSRPGPGRRGARLPGGCPGIPVAPRAAPGARQLSPARPNVDCSARGRWFGTDQSVRTIAEAGRRLAISPTCACTPRIGAASSTGDAWASHATARPAGRSHLTWRTDGPASSLRDEAGEKKQAERQHGRHESPKVGRPRGLLTPGEPENDLGRKRHEEVSRRPSASTEEQQETGNDGRDTHRRQEQARRADHTRRQRCRSPGPPRRPASRSARVPEAVARR